MGPTRRPVRHSKKTASGLRIGPNLLLGLEARLPVSCPACRSFGEVGSPKSKLPITDNRTGDAPAALRPRIASHAATQAMARAAHGSVSSQITAEENERRVSANTIISHRSENFGHCSGLMLVIISIWEVTGHSTFWLPNLPPSVAMRLRAEIAALISLTRFSRTRRRQGFNSPAISQAPNKGTRLGCDRSMSSRSHFGLPFCFWMLRSYCPLIRMSKPGSFCLARSHFRLSSHLHSAWGRVVRSFFPLASFSD